MSSPVSVAASSATAESTRNDPTLFALLAASAGLIAANLYYNQPLLADMAQSFHVSPGAVGAIPTLTQLGYGLGMLFLVPLGDRFERSRLIVGMTAVAAVTLVGVACAPNLFWLTVGSLALGVASMAPQLIVPYAAGAGPAALRGRAVGTVMGGLITGILLSRALSGVVAAHFGWRTMYGLAAAMMAVLMLVLRARLPLQAPEKPVPVAALYTSLGTVIRTQPVLRLHSVIGALTFATFSLFWTTLSFHLAAPPHHLGSEVVGLFSIVGVAGALAAPMAGRFADRRDPRIVNAAGMLTVLLSFAVFGLLGHSLLGVALGVVLLDVGVQANQISNQARIFSLDPNLRNRINTVYMSTYFAGGALGSLLGSYAWTHGGWTGVCLAGGALGVLALVVFGTVTLASKRGAGATR
ncbi:MFS transporter [Pendulispora albinea]|uniref:MFS transporter n=1 Tax=Pendulispora albinea TaxID=2741071 RepID=A0ABZ2LXT3_9BACT